MNTRTVAFYLPQYHPVPENDRFWGKGFTEWRNVARARPLFPGHYQPHIPADLGFYDLRVAQTHIDQAELASQYGIDGFCYYHYWFQGRRILEMPVDRMLDTGMPNRPFLLCWANEAWTRAWDGMDRDVLVPQEYSHEDDRIHMQWLSRALLDDRYIRIGGRPLLLVYRASSLPHPQRTAEIWREVAHRSGVGEILLGRVESTPADRGNPEDVGFDVAIEFQPDWSNLGRPLGRGWRRRVRRALRLRQSPYDVHRVFDYDAVAERMMNRSPHYPTFPCVTPGWDNSPRREQGAVILRGANPVTYGRWLRASLERQRRSDGLVFINAWNEWAEGNHLEPDLRFGRGFLEVTLEARALSISDPSAQDHGRPSARSSTIG